MPRRLNLSLIALAMASPASAQQADLAITNVNVVNVETGTIEADRTILVSDGKISRIAPADTAPPDAVETIEGAGKFVIPGLIDMHVHMDRGSLPLFLRFGVTTVRDMGTHFAPLEPDSGGQLAIRKEIAAGTLEGPEPILALRILDGDIPRNPRWSMHFASIGTPQEGRELVNQVADAGGDFVKVYTDLDPDVFDAIAEESKRRGLRFAGHVPGQVGYAAAAEAGLHTAEHLRGIFIDVSSEEERWRAEFAREAAKLEPIATYNLTNGKLTEMAATRDPAKEAALFEVLKANDVGMVPTLVVLNDPRWQFPSAMPDPALVEELSPIYQRITTPPEDVLGPYSSVEDALDATRLRSEMVGRMHDAGVTILVGTDATNPFVIPGISMHTEMGMLVRAGMTPAEALRAATLVNARFIDVADRLGSVDEGKEADLVLIGANPLEDIAATRQIEAVIVDGKLHSPDSMKQDIDGNGGD